MTMIKGLHHNAYRCRDTEETRRFYEDFLGLPLIEALQIENSKTGRATNVLHTFYKMGDGSCLAFFEAPEEPFEFKDQHDFDLHIALTVPEESLAPMLDKVRQRALNRAGSRTMDSYARSTFVIRTAMSSNDAHHLHSPIRRFSTPALHAGTWPSGRPRNALEDCAPRDPRRRYNDATAAAKNGRVRTRPDLRYTDWRLTD
jgi:catechol 2,3-dioxygenase-like lactoylglutathione lyase family enzyme